MDLSSRVALVTGAAQGIGAATAAELRRRGADVATIDLNLPESGEGLHPIMADVTSAESVTRSIRDAAEALGPIDILVNNAGINANYDAVTMTEDEWSSVFNTDVRGAWLCAQAVLPGMIARGAGVIINISSIHARATIEGFFPYAAAKSAVEGLTRSLALDYGPSGIRVNAVAPGYTRTRLVEEWLESLPPDGPTLDDLYHAHALRRIADPAEIAAAIAFLASDQASAITGTTLTVDCGLTARFAS